MLCKSLTFYDAKDTGDYFSDASPLSEVKY